MHLLSITFVILKIFVANAYSEDCRTTEKCECMNITSSGRFEYQCPPSLIGSKAIYHVYPASKKLTVDCINSDVLDNTILPVTNFGMVTTLYMQECPVPENGVKMILDSFNIKNLKTLRFDMHARKAVLTNQDFRGLTTLKDVEFRGNNIKFSDTSIFAENMSFLTALIFDGIDIELSNGTFENVRALKVLGISGTEIEYIPKNSFSNLRVLKDLYLYHNKLKRIDSEAFNELTKLKSLELSLNDLETLEENVFSNLENLVQIGLRRNKLGRISRNIFDKCANIELIRMDENPNLNLTDRVFSNFTHLKTVILSFNELKTLPEGLFDGSVNLNAIFLDNNKLESIPMNTFKDLRNLDKLRMSNNKISDLHPETFSSLENLKYLYLQHNNLGTLDKSLFYGLKKLEEINLSHNKIVKLHTLILSRNSNLKKFMMNHNQYDFDSSWSTDPRTPFATYASTNLQEVDLSYNRITKYPYLLHNIVEMTKINLEHNAIREIMTTRMLASNPDGLDVNLNFNNISLIDIDQIWPEPTDNPPKTTISISRNNIYCDCHSFGLKKYIQEKEHPAKDHISLKYNSIYCSGPSKLDGESLEDLNAKALICPLGKNCTKNEECKCNYRSSDRSVIVDCHKRGLSTIPELTLSSIRDDYDFVDFTEVEVNLQHNQLVRCPEEYDGYINVTKLNLRENAIKNVTWIPPSIKMLDLRGNSLQFVDEASLTLFNASNIEELYLGNNPWRCDCEMKNFSVFLRTYLQHKINISDIRCNITGEQLVYLTEKDLCPVNDIMVVLPLTVLICVLFLLGGFSFYLVYQKQILVWLYARGCCRNLWGEEELDKDKIYDAFVSYSHVDEDFVTDHLVSTLEGGDSPYKLCIHVRDWIPGELIQTQIVNSVRDSRRTVVVLSADFLESVWGKVEFKTAHTEAMKEGRARVIIIIYGDVDVDTVDDDLKAYMQTNTYIKWGDPWFWDKLRYALPRNIRPQTETSKKHANMMQFIEGKFQLATKGVRRKSGVKPPIILDPNNLEEKRLTCVA